MKMAEAAGVLKLKCSWFLSILKDSCEVVEVLLKATNKHMKGIQKAAANSILKQSQKKPVFPSGFRIHDSLGSFR
jgi:hypothetical protein